MRSVYGAGAMSRLLRLARLPVFLAAAALLTPLPAHCLTWDYVPTISVGTLYESNPRSVSQSSLEDDAYAATAIAQLDIVGETAASRLAFQPRAEGAVYTGTTNASDYDYLNYFLPVSAQWTRQLAQFDLDASYRKTSTRSFPSVDPNTDPETNPTRPRIDEYQETWSLRPSASWQLDQRDILSVSLDLDDVSFTKSDITGRPDYQGAIGEVSYTRSLNTQNRISATGSLNAYSSELPGTLIENDTVTYGVYLGYEFSWSESTSMGANVGGAWSDISVKGLPVISTPLGLLPCLDPAQQIFVPCELKSDDKNFLGQLFFRQQTAESITTELSVGRSIQPSSDGAQVTSDSASAFMTKKISPMVTGSLGATYSRQEAIGARDVSGGIGQRFDREYYSVQASLTWRLTRTWRVQGAYSFYQDEQTEGVSYTVPRHRVNVYLTYTGLGSH